MLRSRTDGGGALESGLSAMTDLNVATAACDVLVAVALASTLFFAVPTGAARGRVALYLLTTVAPFAVVAPFVGPLLDRVGRFRRMALAATLVARGILTWLMAKHGGGLALYPLALGVLVCSKGYGVARSAIVPRLLPPRSSLVAVNSRLQLSSTVGSIMAAPIALGVAHWLGSPALLRGATFAYFATAWLVLRLPVHLDRPRQPEEHVAKALPAVLLGRHAGRLLGNVPAALRHVLPLRALVGFLTLFLAFYLRSHARGTTSLGALAGVVAGGGLLGLLIGRAAARRRPEVLIALSQLLSLLSCLAAVIFFSFPAALALAGLATLGSVMAKLSLDTVIQRDVREDIRASVFGRSETAVQLAWVVGGGLGLIPFPGRIGFVVAAVGTAAAVLAGLQRVPPRPRAPGQGEYSRSVTGGRDRFGR